MSIFNIRNTDPGAGYPTYSDASRALWYIVALPVAVALVTFLIVTYENYALWHKEFFLLMAIELAIIFIFAGVEFALYWYYRYRMRFERIG